MAIMAKRKQTHMLSTITELPALSLLVICSQELPQVFLDSQSFCRSVKAPSLRFGPPFSDTENQVLTCMQLCFYFLFFLSYSALGRGSKYFETGVPIPIVIGI